jgi:hypothetical protein
MTSYTNSLSGGLIQPSNMSYAAYPFKDDLILAWPSAFSNNPKVTAAIMDLTAEEEGLSVILPDARHVSVGENILLNNRGEADFAVVSRNEAGELAPVIPVLKSGQSFYIYLTDNSQPQGNWNVIPFGAGSVVVTSVGAESNDESALIIEGNPSNPVRSAGLFTFKLSEALRALAVFTKKGLATLTSKGWEGRTLQAGQNIAVKDGDGEKGDPVIATKEDVGFKTVTTEGMKTRTLTTESYTGKNSIKQDALAAESVPLDKTLASGKPCLVYGQAGGQRYFEMDMSLNPLGIVTMGPEGKMNVYNLSSVWYYNKGEYEGGKLVDQSTPLSKLDAGSLNDGVLGSGAETQKVSLIFAQKEVYGLLSGGGGAVIAFRGITNILNNAPRNETKGTLLQDDTVPYGKIQSSTNPLAGVKFLDCGVQSNNTNHNFYLFKKTKGTWKSTGVYTFAPTNGYETDYFMPFVTFRGGVYQCEILQENKTSFTIHVFNKQGHPADASFVIMIVGYQ